MANSIEEMDELFPETIIDPEQLPCSVPDITCKSCDHLICVQWANKYYFCMKQYKQNSSQLGKRVRHKDPACILYKARTEKIPVYQGG